MSTPTPLGPPQERETQRIYELERALQDAVDFLRRLPRVPVTVNKAADLEAVLNGNTAILQRSYTGGSYSPAGIPRLRAEYIGNLLFLKCGARSDEDAIEADLVGHLRRGVTLTCKRTDEKAPFSELELSYSNARSARSRQT